MLCVSVCLCGNWTDLGDCPCAGFRERYGWIQRVRRCVAGSLPATHGKCHSCSELKPTWPLCEGEALPSDTNNTPVHSCRYSMSENRTLVKKAQRCKNQETEKGSL